MSWLGRVWDHILRATAAAQEEQTRPCEHRGSPGRPCHCSPTCACRGYTCLTVHFAPDATGYPLCGALVGSPWAMNIEAVTCQDCRDKGMPMHIQHWVNNR